MKYSNRLDLALIEEVMHEARLSTCGKGWLLTNREGEPTVDKLSFFLNGIKAEFQSEILFNKTKGLFELISDCNNGNLDKHIDKFNEYPDYHENGDPILFDPYKELEYILNTDGIEDLPFKISDFYELLQFSQTFGLRKKAMSQAFSKFFGDVTMYIEAQDQNGDTVMVLESELPEYVREELKNNREIKNGEEQINVEHCFDNYDRWYIEISRLVNLKMPFSDMLQLFK